MSAFTSQPAALLLGLALCACQTPEPPQPEAPLRAPDVEVTAGYFLGTPLSGARPILADDIELTGEEERSLAEPSPEPDPLAAVVEGLMLECTLLYLETLPLSGRTPLAAQADLVADLRGSLPLLPSASLAAEAEVYAGEDAAKFLEALRNGEHGRWLALAGDPTALPPGSTYALDAFGREFVADPADFLDEYVDRGPIPRRVGLRLGYPLDASFLRVALVLQDLDPEQEAARRKEVAETGTSAPLPPMAPEDESVRMELVRVAESYDPDTGPLVLVVPSPFRGGNGRSFALVVEPQPQASDHSRSRAQARADASTRRASAAALLLAPDEDEARAIELEAALAALANGSPRSAFLVLTQRTGAPLATDLALTLTSDDLQALSEAVFTGRTPAQIASRPHDVAMVLERAAYDLLVTRALEDTIDPEQSTLLYLHTGALGPFPDALQEILRQSSDLGDLERKIVEENLTFLEDSSSSARLRAHDWLHSRGRAIEGFDPLAERAERKAVLEAARTAAQVAAIEPPVQETDPSQ